MRLTNLPSLKYASTRTNKIIIITAIIGLCIVGSTYASSGYALAGYSGSSGAWKGGPSRTNTPTPSPTLAQASPSPTIIATPTPTPTSTPTPTEFQIQLNDFAEYTNGAGKSLDLMVGQVAHFSVGEAGVIHQHTATVKEIGTDYVILTIASDPFDLHVTLGSSQRFTLNGQDIQINLLKISGDSAHVSFAQVQASSNQPSSPATTDTSSAQPEIPWLIIAIIIISALLVVSLTWWLFRKLDLGESPYVPQKYPS